MIEKGPSVDSIIKNLSLANHDGEIKGIAVIYITGEELKLEIEMSFGDGQAYAMNTALDLLKDSVMDKLRNAGAADWKDRD